MRSILLTVLAASFVFGMQAQQGTTTVPLANSPALSESASADLRPIFDRYGLARRQQGARPTCSVFTVAGAIEFAIAQRQGSTPRLSIDFLNWAANDVCKDTDDGAFFSDLWKGFSSYGICAESDMPYQGKPDATRHPSATAFADAKTRLPLELRLHWIKEWDVKTGLTSKHVSEIKQTLLKGWPVCGGFRWPKQEQWVEHVLQMCPPEAVRDGHSVLLAGFRDDPKQPGGGVFLFRNTAGNGEDGWMSYEYASAYMNDAAWVDFDSRQESRTAAGSPSTVALYDPLGAAAALPKGRNRRISSNELPQWHDANLDMTILPPGKTLEMPVLQGPGMITHIWMTSHAGRVNELNALSLRIYWDGREEPGVEAPLGDFFAVGQGKPAEVNSMPVQVSPSGALACYWRMPFAKSARIVIANDNPNRTAGLYWQVDWTELESLPANTPYFHAQYRQEYPAVCGQDYLVAELEGTGQYVGTVMSVTLAQDGWWGEGDDFFYIDGETTPSLQGTGSEDYFNDAWGFRPRISPWFGQPRWEGDNAGDSGVCYRWHILDPVAFNRSLKFAIEHKGNRVEDIEGFYLERPDFLSSVAFWYQTGKPKRFASIPSYPERAVPWQQQHLVKSFRKAQTTGNTRVRIETSGMFGARPVLSWTNSEPGARMTLPFSAEKDGRYAVRLTAATGPDFGACHIEIDGKRVASGADFRSRDGEELDLSLGTHDLSAGEHTVTFVALAGSNGKAGTVAVEMLRLLALPPEATRAVKTHHEAHFIRLAIGRAVYAYRLAYDELPESLETLVKAELLPARFLADENNKPLRSQRKDGNFVVESVGGAEPWTHEWQGLDARR